MRFIRHPLCIFTAVGVLCLVLIYRHAYTATTYVAQQPVPFEHSSHTVADKVNMQCQSCHAGAEKGAGAGMPASSACLDCHRHILADDARLLPLHAVANTDSSVYHGEPLRWVRQAPLPAHVHFNHGYHARKGVSCAECHPNPDAPTAHTMQSCLDCHEKHALPLNCDSCHH